MTPNLNVDDFLVMQFITQLYKTEKNKNKNVRRLAKEKNVYEIIFHELRD